MKKLVFILTAVMSLSTYAIDIDNNMGDVLIGPSNVVLESYHYDYQQKFDQRFLNLSREDALQLVLARIAFFDPEKASDWRKKIDQLWTTRNELAGVVFSSKKTTDLKDHHFECTYRFRNNKFLLASDVFYRLPGFQQAFLILQAMLVKDFVSSEPKRIETTKFENDSMVRPYFSILNGQGDYLDFIKFFHKQFYPNYSQIWYVEFQIGQRFVAIDISNSEFLNSDLLHPKTNRLFRFNSTRQIEITYLTDQVLEIRKSSPLITLLSNGHLKKLQSGDTTYLIKNLNFADRLVTGFQVSDDNQRIEWISTPPVGNLEFTTVGNRPYLVLDYMVPILHFENNYLSKVCNYSNQNCTNF